MDLLHDSLTVIKQHSKTTRYAVVLH